MALLSQKNQPRSSKFEGASTLNNGDPSAIDIISKGLSAAKIVGLNIPVDAPRSSSWKYSYEVDGGYH